MHLLLFIVRPFERFDVLFERLRLLFEQPVVRLQGLLGVFALSVA